MKKIPLLLTTLSSLLFLAATKPPYLILHPENSTQQQVYLIHNTSHHTIYLNHPVTNPSASAGWGSPLNTGAWSTFAVNQPNFILTCADAKNFKQVNCGEVVYVERRDNIKIRGDGTYWLGENLYSIDNLYIKH